MQNKARPSVSSLVFKQLLICLQSSLTVWTSRGMDELEHFGHTLHKSMSMSYDARKAAGRFMSRASKVRDELFFAHPKQKMQAIKLHCCDGCGAMLWDFLSDAAQSCFKSWNTQARLCWIINRKTHTNIVEDFLCEGQTSLRIKTFSRVHHKTDECAK